MGCGASSRPSKIEGDEEEPSSSDQVQVLQPSISAAPPSTKGEVQNFDSAPESDSSSVVAQSTLPYGDGESDEHAQQECRRTSGRIVNVTGSGLTHIGFGDPPLKKENQDTFRLHLHCFAGIDGCAYLAVFDGHGNHGELVAQFAASQMEEIVRTRLETLDCWSPSSVRELLKASFLECEREIEQAPSIGFRGKMSGTTATVAIVLDGILYVASVGDSRLVLLDLYGNPERLSADHRPENETERERIIQAGGCVRSSARFQGENETEQVVEDGTKRVPLRVWLRKDQQKPNGLLQPGPGLMLTRSLGDRISKVAGCIAEPQVTHKVLDRSSHRCVVAGSDGVWDVCSDASVADTVLRFESDTVNACEQIVHDSLAGWEKLGRADNITIVVMNLF